MKKIISLLLFLICAGSIYSQRYDWRVIGEMKNPVWEAQAINDPQSKSYNFIYVLGGYSDEKQDTVDWIQEYYVPTNTWTTVGHMIKPRQNFVAGSWKSDIIYFGGNSRYENEKGIMESWFFNSASSEYIAPSFFDKDSNFARSSATGYVVNDNLYIIGGAPTDGTPYKYLPFITEYNLKNKKIGFTFDSTSGLRPVNNMSFIKGDDVYILGGVVDQVRLSKSISKFNISSRKMELLSTTLPEPRFGGTAVYNTFHNKGYIIGGQDELGKPLSTVWEITFNADGTLEISTNFPTLKYARRGCMAINYNKFIAVLGGKDSTNNVVPYVELLEDTLATSAFKNDLLPVSFSLSQNYPNPFNPSTTINYSIKKQSFVSLKVFDILGQEIVTLVNEIKFPGLYTVTFEANALSKHGLKSGIYYYRLTAGNYSETKKMILMK